MNKDDLVLITISGQQCTGKSVIASRIAQMLRAEGYTNINNDGTCANIPAENAEPFSDVDIFVQTWNGDIDTDPDDGKDVFDRSDVISMAEAYESQLLEERQIQRRVLDAREAVEAENMRVGKPVPVAVLTGKTIGERAEQAAEYIASSEELSNGLYWLELHAKNEQAALEIAEAQRKATEAEISLTKAWLYSQGGVR
jgi:hypothetical protein